MATPPDPGGDAAAGDEALTVSAEDSADLGFSLVAALAGPPEQAARLRALRDGRMRATWSRFALRAAADALVRSDAVRLRLGLGAAALAATEDDDPDDLRTSWAPLHHVAAALELDPAAAFDDAARLADPPVAELLRSFGRRDDLTLSSFGWTLVDRPAGRSFQRDR